LFVQIIFLTPMQRFVFHVVGWAIIETFRGGQFDVVDEFDIGAFVDLGGMTGGEVGDQQPKRSALCTSQRLVVDAINQESATQKRREWNAGVKIVSRGVQPEEFPARQRAAEREQAIEQNGLAAPLGIELADVGDLVPRIYRE
jgi:hypothetical protein